MQTVVVMFPYL